MTTTMPEEGTTTPAPDRDQEGPMTPNCTLDEIEAPRDPEVPIRPERILAARQALLRGELKPDPARIARALRARGIV